MSDAAFHAAPCKAAALTLRVRKWQFLHLCKRSFEDVAGDSQSASFLVPLKVSRNPKTGKPNFLGPFAQGTPDQRFIYLCWGERNNGTWDGFRRAKIQLSHLRYEALEKAMESGQAIKVVVNMTDDKGGPLCASIKEDNIKWEI